MTLIQVLLQCHGQPEARRNGPRSSSTEHNLYSGSYYTGNERRFAAPVTRQGETALLSHRGTNSSGYLGDHLIDVPATSTLPDTNLCYQEAFDWRYWKKEDAASLVVCLVLITGN